MQLVQMQFKFTYPKKVEDDPNRQLFIKYKYNKITESQLKQLHDQLQKLIHDVIRKNYIIMDQKDVYQQIWKKIAKAKHSWNEDAGTKVSTWIVIVCISVINGLRLKVKKNRQRYVLYNDLNPQIQQDDNNQRGQTMALKYGMLEQKPLQNLCFSQQMSNFLEQLTEQEKNIVDIILNVDLKDLNKNGNDKYVKKQITKSYIQQKIGVKGKQFVEIFEGLKQKFKELIIDIKE